MALAVYLNHLQTMIRYQKDLNPQCSGVGRVQAFPKYGSLGMSVPSLSREPTDFLFLILNTTAQKKYIRIEE